MTDLRVTATFLASDRARNQPYFVHAIRPQRSCNRNITTFHELTFPNNNRRSAVTLWLFRSETYYVVLVRKIRELARGVIMDDAAHVGVPS